MVSPQDHPSVPESLPQSGQPGPAPGSRARRRAAVAVALCAVLLLGWTLLPALDPAEIIARLAPGEVGLVLLLIAMMIAHNFIPVPAEVIAICAGGLLGLAAGIVVIWVGAMLGAALAFYLARRFGRDLVIRHTSADLVDRLDATIARWGAPGLLALRLMPIVSFNLINYGAGLCNVRWSTFLWTTAIGILPVLVLSVAAGDQLESVAMGPRFFAVIAAILAFYGLGHWLVGRRKRQSHR